MPNITGTSGDDDIDVTNDNGTLNGNSAGTPIDQVRGRAGDDTISITDSTISGRVVGNGGADAIVITGSVIGGRVASGSDADQVTISGSSVVDVRLGGGDDTLTLGSTSVAGTIDGGTGTDALNLPAGTVVNDSTIGSFTVTAGATYSLTNGTLTLPTGETVAYTALESGTGFPCFCQGTMIQTPQGSRPIDDLKAGDMVLNREGRARRLRWTVSRSFSKRDLANTAQLYPVRIVAGALGQGLPIRDLLVSRQHRMLVQSRIAMRMFGVPEVLIPAVKLTVMPGIYVDERVNSVVYYHLLFDRHEVFLAEGAPTESLFTGPEAIKALTAAARAEIAAILPDVLRMDRTPDPVREIPPGRQQKRLLDRHLRNGRPLL
ncbi:Hint domain-containing protein [Sedimentitalea todarodis]|uniref:Hint domain-containing protein n=1 Tax=Sedimentitalea todarodis TaxID=1631240 RepID=A0ABU3VFV9_9RHOB|nr:Hint domain-containing protein [Sedimentitalea todarodis]MDU9005078.1 Hint domain-containing protein [Sedimentitalea todarodis]